MKPYGASNTEIKGLSHMVLNKPNPSPKYDEKQWNTKQQTESNIVIKNTKMATKKFFFYKREKKKKDNL